MARKVILSPVLVEGWLEAMLSKVERAAAAGLDGEVSGRIEGMLTVDKQGKANLLTKLEADLSPEGAALLMGGAAVGVEGAISVGWDRDTAVGRLASGWCEARFSTKGAAPAASTLEDPAA